MIGSYPPRQCEIATFTHDLVKAICHNPENKNTEVEAYIVAMNDGRNTYSYPKIVKYQIRETEEAVREIDF